MKGNDMEKFVQVVECEGELFLNDSGDIYDFFKESILPPEGRSIKEISSKIEYQDCEFLGKVYSAFKEHFDKIQPDLINADTNEFCRKATFDEWMNSLSAARYDGWRGIIEHNYVNYYVL